MFEPLRIGFFLAGVLCLIGAMLYAGSTMSLPGGFSDISAALIYLYWFAIMAFFFGIFLRSLFLLIEAAQRKKQPLKIG